MATLVRLGAAAVVLLLLVQGLMQGRAQVSARQRTPTAGTSSIDAAIAASVCRGGRLVVKPAQPR
jgi:hypothetical protein